jgi:hypothetical protein
VVPATNPSEPSPGELHPVVGQPYYATANVRSTSQQNLLNAIVYFFWANPALGIITSVNANLIGTSSVSVNAGQTVNALELVPWVPSFVNVGHECIIAAVVADGGPPPAVLDGAHDPTVAQRNLGVVEVGAQMKGFFHYAFQVCNPVRGERSFTIAAEPAPRADATRFLRSLRGDPNLEANATPEHLGFVRSACPDPSEHATAHRVLEDVKLPGFTCTGFSLVGTLNDGTSLIHVTQAHDGRIVGGLSVLVIAEESRRK